VYYYDSAASDWIQKGSDIDGEASNDRAGSSVSLSSDGSIVAIGAPYNDGATGDRAGHVRVFKYDSTTSGWVLKGDDFDGEADLDFSGDSVSLSNDGSILAIGAPYRDVGGSSNAGYVRVYEDPTATSAPTAAPTSGPGGVDGDDDEDDRSGEAGVISMGLIFLGLFMYLVLA